MSRSILACAAVALALTAACGDEGSHDRTRTDAQQLLGEAPDPRIVETDDVAAAITVALTEFEIELDRDTVAAGDVRFRVRNNGQHEHALVVEGQGERWSTSTIQPGQWAVLEVELQSGTYTLHCPIEPPTGLPHAEAGMEATLVVGASG